MPTFKDAQGSENKCQLMAKPKPDICRRSYKIQGPLLKKNLWEVHNNWKIG